MTAKSYTFVSKSQVALKPEQRAYLQAFIHSHDSSQIAEAMAVVWCTPHSRKGFPEKHLVAFHTKLVRSTHVRELVHVQEFLDDVFSENVASPTRRLTQTIDRMVSSRAGGMGTPKTYHVEAQGLGIRIGPDDICTIDHQVSPSTLP